VIPLPFRTTAAGRQSDVEFSDFRFLIADCRFGSVGLRQIEIQKSKIENVLTQRKKGLLKGSL
jgi:hypothetical protein